MIVQSMPYPAIGGGATTMLVGSITTPTFDNVTGNFGGGVASAAFAFGSYHDVVNDPGETTPEARITYGSVVGTNQFSVSHARNDRSRRGTSSVYAYRSTAAVGTIEVSLELVSNGVAPTSPVATANRRISLAVFGPDVQAANGLVDLGTGTSAIPVNCGFVPDAVIFFISMENFSGSNSFFFNPAMGIAHKDGTQFFTGTASNDSALATSYGAFLNDCAVAQINGNDGTISYKVTAGGFTGTGFTLTPSASTGGDKVGYLALKFPSGSKLVAMDSPTTTGNRSVTGLGFTPQFVMTVLGDETGVFASPHVGVGFGIGAATASAQFAASFSTNNGATGGRNYSNPVAILGPINGDSDANKATLTSFNSGGATFNYSAANGTARKGFALFVQ